MTSMCLISEMNTTSSISDTSVGPCQEYGEGLPMPHASKFMDGMSTTNETNQMPRTFPEAKNINNEH